MVAMKIIAILVISLSVLTLISSENSTKPDAVTTAIDDAEGYKLIQRRLDSFEERFSNALERLVASVNDGRERHDSRLLERMTKLETLGETLTENQKSMQGQINDVKSQLSEVVDNSRKLLTSQPIYTIASCNMASQSGVYRLADLDREVYCEMDTLQGGWLVIQQRTDLSLSFNRSWSEYRSGFGRIGRRESFWLGNEAIHQLTNGGGRQYEVCVEFKKNNYAFGQYSKFHVAGEDDKYRLRVDGYSGELPDEFKWNDNMQFSTYDSDNDKKEGENCANGWAIGGWWYNNCGRCNLNNDQPQWSWIKGFYSRMMIRQKL